MQTRQDKKTRLQVIRMIVSSQAIESQEELLEEMDKAGYPCTQTTLSRDLKQLRISKVRARNGHPVYALPHEGQFVHVPTREEMDLGKWGVRFSGQLMVVHTPPGHASMVAYDIDCAKRTPFIGTVAGDDTIFIACRENDDASQLMAYLKQQKNAR